MVCPQVHESTRWSWRMFVNLDRIASTCKKKSSLNYFTSKCLKRAAGQNTCGKWRLMTSGEKKHPTSIMEGNKMQQRFCHCSVSKSYAMYGTSGLPNILRHEFMLVAYTILRIPDKNSRWRGLLLGYLHRLANRQQYHQPTNDSLNIDDIHVCTVYTRILQISKYLHLSVWVSYFYS